MRILVGVILITLSATAWAADDDEKLFVYGTYLNCDVSGEDAADATFEKYMAPAYEATLKSGDIVGWGYMKHVAGGKWRRLTYHMGPSVTAVIKAGKKQGDMVDEKLKPRDNNFGKACHSHDDYIWENKAGNTIEQRGKVGLSVYLVCNIGNESRADELVDEVFAPIYDKQLEAGTLTSWGWFSHIVGGKYRRLLAITAEDFDQLFAARDELLGSIGGTSAGREFSSICGSHQDYLWDIVAEGR
ncbi:MAG: hypothetical protein OER80_08725 [Gammaproteobacteria bacterium]|nr:hypothetical protein [Gammaproteobacteria bacterium]MDH3767549.1 hypothetical protein [Gammaproteobacteria bacterium]